MRFELGGSSECLGEDALVRVVACIFRGYLALVDKDAEQGVIFGEQLPLLFVGEVGSAVADVDRRILAIARVNHHYGGFAAERGLATAFADDGVMRFEQGSAENVRCLLGGNTVCKAFLPRFVELLYGNACSACTTDVAACSVCNNG